MNPTRNRPYVTWALIAVCLIVYFVVQPSPGSEDGPSTWIDYNTFLYKNAAIACELTTGQALTLDEINYERCSDSDAESPYFPEKNIWLAAIFTMFLHGDIAHVLFNMWSLWIFGDNVEEAFGTAGYVALYAVTGIIATAGFVLFNQDLTVPLIGASGAIAGVMGAYLVLFPRHLIKMWFFFRIVAVRATLFLGIWFASQITMVGSNQGIAWQAHVAGFLAGMAIAAPLRKRLLANTLNPDPPQSKYSAAA